MIKRLIITVFFFFPVSYLFAQAVSRQLQSAYQQFESDEQLKHATSSLYVIDAKTGKIVFDKNSQVGLAPASTQKIITTSSAFELLGKGYRFKTEIRKKGNRTYIVGYGDPTLGSWRYDKNAASNFFDTLLQVLKTDKEHLALQNIVPVSAGFDDLLPGGWIYEDIANYYGAGAKGLNWHENQYDLTFIPGKRTGDSAILQTMILWKWNENFINHVKTGPPGSGDNAYVYFIPGTNLFSLEGTVPAGVSRFTISASESDPRLGLMSDLSLFCGPQKFTYENTVPEPIDANGSQLLYTHYSPTLDSIVYWFLKKSINLYGEALIKTLACEKKGFGFTDSGVAIVKDFWKQKGIDEEELNISDGSGLSPQNRVTTHAQVEILKYAKSRDWFPYFYDALPEYNNMKMKSGTIRDVKAFCGYQTSADGNQYIFSFIVNNYNGPTSDLVNKMYRVLDKLK